MVFHEYISSDNPTGLIIGIVVILFAISYYALVKMIRNTGLALIASIAISGIATWSLYKNDFYGWQDIIVFFIYIVVFIIFIKLIWSFFKYLKKSKSKSYEVLAKYKT